MRQVCIFQQSFSVERGCKAGHLNEAAAQNGQDDPLTDASTLLGCEWKQQGTHHLIQSPKMCSNMTASAS